MKQKIEIEIDVPDGKKAVWKDGKVVFEDAVRQLPKTWEEFCGQTQIKDGECYLDADSSIAEAEKGERYNYIDRIVLPNKQAAEQHLALMQLHQLRDCYRQGGTPNYTDSSLKVNITKCESEPVITPTIKRASFLSFPTREIAEQFIINFRDLIEQAGDLI